MSDVTIVKWADVPNGSAGWGLSDAQMEMRIGRGPLGLKDREREPKVLAMRRRDVRHAAAKAQPFNWTLASLVALTVLIMQLFYLLLLR